MNASPERIAMNPSNVHPIPKPNTVHLVTPYLFHTGSWVYSQLIGLERYMPVVFTQKKENLNQFPLHDIVCSDDFPLHERVLNRFYRRVSGNFGLFFPREVRKYAPVLFHAHMGFEGVRWLKFVEKTGLPLITTFYGQDVSKLGKIPYWLERYQRLFHYGKIFLAEGNHLKDQLRRLGCPEHKIVIQHLGVDIDRYPVKHHSDNKKIIILQVSTFREKKGIEYSLKAMALVKTAYPAVEYRLIGTGDSPESIRAIESMVDDLGLRNHVKMIGVVPHKQMLTEMAKADIFLHPSVTASDGDNEGGVPVSIIEAAAIGLPVVATVHADIPEAVVHGRTGFLAHERDERTIGEHVLRLIQEPETRSAMGSEGKKHIAREYSLTTQSRKLEEIYDSVI